MTFSARRLESVLKEVNRDLQAEGVLTERLTQDIWTKLMSNLLQGEYMLGIPIRQELQRHIRSKRPDKIYTFNQIIHRLDEILDRYIPPPDLSEAKKRKDKKGGKKPEVIVLPALPEEKNSEPKMAVYQETKRVIKASTKSTTAQTDTNMMNVNFEEKTPPKSNREMSMQTSRVAVNEATTQIKGETFIAETRHMSVETDKEEKYEEDEISREQYFTMQANQSVLMTTVEDQQMKIKRLEEAVHQLENRNQSLTEEIKSIGNDKGDKINVFSKVEREIKFLRNELKIKERTLQLSLIERNELLDRLSAVTSTKMSNGSLSSSDLSEINRPTQIADKYSKLFDSDWADAFHLLTLEMKEERTVVQCLLEILIDSYSFCKNTSETRSKFIIESLLYPFRSASDIKNVDPYVLENTTKELITDLKKSTAKETVIQVQVQFLRAMQKSKKKVYEDKTAKKLSSYIDRCVELCWYMVNQDPILYIDDKPPKSGDDFDRDSYRFHTKSGSKVDYLVWPALYLAKGNYMLLQGVAQPKQEGVALRIASSNSMRNDFD